MQEREPGLGPAVAQCQRAHREAHDVLQAMRVANDLLGDAEHHLVEDTDTLLVERLGSFSLKKLNSLANIFRSKSSTS